MYIVANGDLSKNITRKWIFLVANATVLVAVWSPVLSVVLKQLQSRLQSRGLHGGPEDTNF